MLYNCSQRNLSTGRDLNAAINIQNQAQVLLKDLLPGLKFKGYEGVQLSLFSIINN